MKTTLTKEVAEQMIESDDWRFAGGTTCGGVYWNEKTGALLEEGIYDFELTELK